MGFEVNKVKYGLGVLCAVLMGFTGAAAEESAIGSAGYPLVVFRLTDKPFRNPEFFRQTCKVHARYPGAFDDFWYGGGNPLCRIEVCERNLKKFAELKPLMEQSGMRLSFQQGLTLGHNYCYLGTPGTQAAAGVYAQEEVEPFPADAWQVEIDGTRAEWRNLCPRSPAVLEYEAKFVKTVLSVLHPYTYWLDDDLRLGWCKTACYCDRCLAAFNAFAGTKLTREELVGRLQNGAGPDELREQWMLFCEESLAGYGRAVRKAADEVMPECRLSLQTVRATSLTSGRDFAPVLRELSGNGRVPAGIRPGDGCYTEERPELFLEKSLIVAREAERCRKLGRACGTVCYEEETYPRLVAHKTPQAIVTEATLAFASGCDSVSLYWADGETDESIEDYERFVKAVAGARGYWERLAASTVRTSLGGLACFWGANRLKMPGFELNDYAGMAEFLRWGIPVTVDEATASNKLYTIAGPAWNALAKGEKPQCVHVRMSRFPRSEERQACLDELDRASNGRFPVRIDRMHPMRVLPRIDRAGATDSVTLFNLSLGAAEALAVRVRQPRSRKAVWQTPLRGAVPLVVENGAKENEVVVRIPEIAAWSIGTLFFE